MADRNRILVLGATGAQGGSVARHLLDSGTFDVRALTRNPFAQKAAQLQAAGAEVFAGDLDDPASIRRALDGCWGVFGVTNFWEHFSKEYQQGCNLIDAVADARPEWFIFSSLPHVRRLTGGKLSVPHFDMKGQLEEYARQRKLPAIYVHVAFYYENFLNFTPPKRRSDGAYVFGFPQGDTPLAAVAVEDVGGVVTTLFKSPDAHRDRVVGIVGDDRPPAAYAHSMSRTLGVNIVYEYIPRDVFAGFGFPGADDLANMFEYNRLHIPSRAADVAESRQLYPGMRDFDTWLQANREKFAPILAAG